jgi:uncharacterized protein
MSTKAEGSQRTLALKTLSAAAAAAFITVSTVHAQSVPLGDYHQHLFSPAITKLSPSLPSITASDVVSLLDAAGIQRAVVLSVAYLFGRPGRNVENEHDKVKAENDWIGEQVGRFPKRLIGFCSFNPLREYALEELSRCAQDPRLRGLKLHLGNSLIDYRNPQHIERLRQIFRAANGYRMPVVIHMRASISRKMPYGGDAARIFLNDILPVTPGIPVQIAHLAGAGGYDDPLADEAVAVFVEAIANGDPHTKQLYFDVTTVASRSTPPDQAKLVAKRLRQLGLQRILYGSDAATGGNLPPREGWAAFRRLPLAEDEFRTIAGNVPSYLR